MSNNMENTNENQETFFTAEIIKTYKNCGLCCEEFAISFNGNSKWFLERHELELLRDTINNILDK